MSAPRPPTNKWLVTVSVTFGTLMGAIDASIVNVAVPHIRGAVGATVEEITWVSTGFVIATVLVMPLTAFLGRFFGQKRFYMFSLALFIAGSALCGLARSLEALVAFRAIQGLGAGALQPTEQAILRQTFPPKEQGMAMALFGMAVMIGPAVGPTLGGYIVDNWTWPWIFYINLPVGLLGLFMVGRFVQEPDDIRIASKKMAEEQRKNLDWQGIALLCVGLSTLQYVLEEGESKDWFDSKAIVVCALLAVFSLMFFVWRELTAKVPAVNLRLFKDRVFMSGTVVGALMFSMLMVSMFVLPLFMQELLGFTATQSGMALMPRVFVMMLATPIVGRLYNKVSPRFFVALGIFLVSVGSWNMSHFTLETSARGIVGAILIQGVGFSCLFVPLTTVALSSIPREKLPDATGLNSLLRQIGGSIGLAGFATLLPRFEAQATAAMSAHLAPGSPEVLQRLHMMEAGLFARGMDAVSAQAAALRALAGTVARQAMVMSFDKVFFLSAAVFVAIIPLVYFLRSAHEGESGPAHVEPVEM